MKRLLLFALFAIAADAQSVFVPADGSYVGTVLKPTNPTSCVPSLLTYNYLLGTLWGCSGSPGAMGLTQISGSGGGSSTRTWSYATFGVCQGAVAGASIWIPTTNAPVFNACTATTQQGEWTVPAGSTTTNWGFQLVVPAGITGSWTMALTWRTADTTTAHAITFQPSYACVALGAVPDNPTYTNLSTFTINPSATPSINANATLTFTPTCAAGSQFRLLLTPSANTFTSAAQFSYQSVAVQALN